MILNIILLVIATISTSVYVICFLKGEKYTYLVENLDDNEFFLKDIYVVGFALNETRLFSLKGEIKKSLYKDAKLVWDNIYAEYYATLAWAQFLSLELLLISVGTSIAVLFGPDVAPVVLAMVMLFALAIWNLTMSKMKEMVDERRLSCSMEFPNMVSKLSLLINSGMVLREAWYTIAESKKGALYELMLKACEFMDNGESEIAAIYKFGVLSDSPEIKKFTSAIAQSIEKGNSDLADFLLAQSTELLAHKRQVALQQGEIAAGKLIIPLGITFAGIIMIIVSAAMQSMSF